LPLGVIEFGLDRWIKEHIIASSGHPRKRVAPPSAHTVQRSHDELYSARFDVDLGIDREPGGIQQRAR